MADSFLLSIFFLGALAAEVFYFKRARLDLEFLKRGVILKLSKNQIILVAVIVFFIFYGLGYWIISQGESSSLQLFYELVYFCSLGVTLFLLGGRNKPLLRLAVAVLVSVLFLLIVHRFPMQWGQNIYMALALLWVAPVVFRQLKIGKNLFFIIITVGMVLDILFVWILKGGEKVAFRDEYLFLNGLVTVGEYYLGIGDFLMGYLLVGAVSYYNNSEKGALVLGFLLSVPRFLIRILFPNLAGVIFPYYLFMVPIFFAVYFLFDYLTKKRLCLKN